MQNVKVGASLWGEAFHLADDLEFADLAKFNSLLHGELRGVRSRCSGGPRALRKEVEKIGSVGLVDGVNAR